jgi:zinc transport system permease protein
LTGEAPFLPAAVAAAAVALACGLLSPLVVLKRAAFAGQGISHTAFAGVGVAALLGLYASGAHPAAGYAVVAAVCALAALGIARLARDPRVREDTAIGIFLAAAMALGFLLLHAHAARITAGRAPAGDRAVAVDDVLFGSLVSVGRADAGVTIAALALIATLAYVFRRELLFWAFDEPAARAFGVRTERTRALFMLLVAAAVVVAMRTAGVVLATALLVLPGAAALRLTDRLAPTFALSAGLSLLGAAAGLVISFELDWPSGPSVVLALVGLLIAAHGAARLRGALRSGAAAAGDDDVDAAEPRRTGAPTS